MGRGGSTAVAGGRSVSRHRLAGRRLAAAATAGLVSAAVAALVTRHGVRLSTDSAVYVGTAENLRAGRGATTPFTSLFEPYRAERAVAFGGAVPLTQFPPLYPALLAATAPAFGGVVEAARWLNVAAVALCAVGSATLGWRLSGRASAAAGAGVGVGLAANVLALGTFALTDVLHLGLALVALAVLAPVLGGASSPARLAATGVVLAAASMVRYGGVALAATGVACALLRSGPARAARVRRAVLLGAPSAVAVLGWLAYGRLRGGESARRAAVHPPGRDDARLGAHTVLDWFTDVRLPTPLRWLAVVVLAAAAAAALARGRSGAARQLAVLVAYLAVHLLVLVATRTFADASTAFDYRLMLPAQAVLVVLFVSAAAAVPALALRSCLVGLVALLAVSPWNGVIAWLYAGSSDTADAVEHGVPAPEQGRYCDELERLAQGGLLATNFSDQLYNDCRLASIQAPSRFSPFSGEDNGRYRDEMAELRRVLASRDGTLVTYPVAGIVALSGVSSPEDAERLLGVDLVRNLDGVRIYRPAGA